LPDCLRATLYNKTIAFWKKWLAFLQAVFSGLFSHWKNALGHIRFDQRVTANLTKRITAGRYHYFTSVEFARTYIFPYGNIKMATCLADYGHPKKSRDQ
jgi:hypothetical protein